MWLGRPMPAGPAYSLLSLEKRKVTLPLRTLGVPSCPPHPTSPLLQTGPLSWILHWSLLDFSLQSHHLYMCPSPNNMFPFTRFQVYINGIMLCVFFSNLLSHWTWESWDSPMLPPKSWHWVPWSAWWTVGLSPSFVVLQTGWLDTFMDRCPDVQGEFL